MSAQEETHFDFQRFLSRFPNFTRMTAEERLRSLVESQVLTQADADQIQGGCCATGGLSLEKAQQFVENCIGGFTLPLGIASYFRLDGEDIFVPMCVEESSVVAAASFGAKLARTGGGFFAEKTETIATAQVQFVVSEQTAADFLLMFAQSVRQHVFYVADRVHPRLVERGGGVRDIELRQLSRPGYFVLHIHVDTCEAMGANIVNTIAEEVGRLLPTLFPCEVRCRILTNLCLRRITRVKCEIALSALERNGYTGDEAARRICEVAEFAELDPFRAATHNKGVLNGIDAVVIATGNDWRAVEAGCHAFASFGGSYQPLTRWFLNDHNRLQGEIAVPIAVGTTGGVTRLHGAAAACLRLMGSPSSAKLSAIIAGIGLAQNLSALRALACEGIQTGHMALHKKNLDLMRQEKGSATR